MNQPDRWLEALDAYVARHPDETPMAERIAELIRAHEDCLSRACLPGHLTASAWVTSADGTWHVLLHHRKLEKWLQPGGHADGDPDLPGVATREAREETGLEHLEVVPAEDGSQLLDIDVHAIPTRYDADGGLIEAAHEHHDLRFLLRATGDETLAANEESNAVRWVTTQQVAELTRERSVLRLLDKACHRLSAGLRGH